MKIRNFVIVGLIALAFVLTPFLGHVHAETTMSVDRLIQTIRSLQQQLVVLQREVNYQTTLSPCGLGDAYNYLNGSPCLVTQVTTQVASPSIVDYEISTPTTTPSLTVIAPNGGEVLFRSHSYPFYWSSTGLSSSATILLSLVSTSSGLTYGLGSPLNDGSQNVYIPQNIPVATSTYRFQVMTSSTTSPGASDLSDGLFSIVASSTGTPTTTPSLTVIAPNGGEILQQSQQFPIRWTASTSIPTVNLNLTQNGTTYFPLASNVNNNGLYN